MGSLTRCVLLVSLASILHAQSTVVLTDLGPVGAGGDDTDVLQAALNATSIQGQILRIPAGTYNVRPLYLPANANLVLDADAVIQATSGYGLYDHLLNIDGVQNVRISGTTGRSIFRMRKSEYIAGEYRHCLSITGANHVVVAGVQCNDSGGDGAYIGEGAQGYSSDIQISDSVFNNNRRQGMSIISARHLIVTNCTFSNTSGTLPSDGIDIEPNQPQDSLQDIVITGGSSANNAGDGVAFSIGNLHASSSPVSITISKFATLSNGKSGFYATNEQSDGNYNGPGTILVTDSSSTGDMQYGAVASYWEVGGTALRFQNYTVTNVNNWHNNIDNAAIAVKRGGGATHLMGNVHFSGVSIVDTAGNLDNYLSVWDWSYVGVSQLDFVKPAALSGARNGQLILNGRAVPGSLAVF